MSAPGGREASAGAPSAAGVRVRAARPDDLPRVWELLHGLAVYERLEHEVVGSAERLGGHLFGPQPLLECRVAEADGGLLGYALFYPLYSSFHTAPRMWLEDLFVEPAARGRGAGRALLAAVAARALERGCARLDWHVLDWNHEAIAFYRRAGASHAAAGWLQYGLGADGLRALARGAAPQD